MSPRIVDEQVDDKWLKEKDEVVSLGCYFIARLPPRAFIDITPLSTRQ